MITTFLISLMLCLYYTENTLVINDIYPLDMSIINL